MAIEKVVSKTVNQLSFKIDKKSWNNLNKFQKRLSQVKQQMSGIKGKLTYQVHDQAAKSATRKLRSETPKKSVEVENKQKAVELAEKLMSENKDILANQKMMDNLHQEALRENVAREAAKKKLSEEQLKDKQKSIKLAEQLMAEEKDILANQKMIKQINKESEKERKAEISRRESIQKRWDQRRLRRQQALQKAEREAHRENNRRTREANIARNRIEASEVAHRRVLDYMRQQRDAGRLTNEQYKIQRQNLDRIHQRMVQQNRSRQRMREDYRLVNDRIREISRKHTTWLSKLNKVNSVLTSGAFVGALGFFTAGRGVMQTGQDFESLQATLIMTEGSMDAAGKKLQWLRKLSNQLGVDVKDAAEGFTRLNVAGMDKIASKDLEDLYVGFSQYSVATGTTKFRQEKAINAFVQMIDKGNLMA